MSTIDCKHQGGVGYWPTCNFSGVCELQKAGSWGLDCHCTVDELTANKVLKKLEVTEFLKKVEPTTDTSVFDVNNNTSIKIHILDSKTFAVQIVREYDPDEKWELKNSIESITEFINDVIDVEFQREQDIEDSMQNN